MQVEDEIKSIEKRLAIRNVPLTVVLTVANINRSTWTRWKSGVTSPRMNTWTAAQDAVAKLLGKDAEVGSQQ